MYICATTSSVVRSGRFAIRIIFIYVILNVISARLYWPFADDVARYHYDWYDISCPKVLGLNGLCVTSPTYSFRFISVRRSKTYRE